MTRFVATMHVTFEIVDGSEALALADAMELSGRMMELSTASVEIVEVFVDTVEEETPGGE